MEYRETFYTRHDFGSARDSYSWPAHEYVKFEYAELTLHDQNCSFIVYSAEQAKNEVKTISFHHCPKIEVIPSGILDQFPNFNGIVIYDSNISPNLFCQNFEMLQYLCLSGNKIKSIAENEFSALPKLKWISLAGNEIEELPHRIFKHNSRLEYINLEYNDIRLIHPNFFNSLANLIEVSFVGNKLVNQKFYRIDPIYSIDLMVKKHLKILFDNYSSECDSDDEDPADQEAKINFLQMKYDLALEELKVKDLKIEELETKIQNQGKLLRIRENAQISSNFGHQVACKSDLIENYKNFLETSSNFDVKLQFKTQEILLAHRSVLEAHSPIFADVLESRVPVTPLINIVFPAEVNFQLMEKAIKFIYSGEIEFSSDQVPELLDIAKKFKFASLEQSLMQQLADKISIENVLSFYRAADEENLEDKKSEILDFLVENLPKIMSSPKWNEICNYPDLVKDIFKKTTEN